jgi:hypothetical protein
MGCGFPVIASTWRPLLDGELADRAWRAVSVLGEELAGDGTPLSAPSAGQPTDPTLATGDAGVALFLAHLSRTRADAEGHLADAARHRCGRMLAGALRAHFHPGLFSGLLGVAWTLGQVAESSIDLDCEVEGAVAAIDRALLRILRRERQPWHYDLSGGLAGVGVYALERLPRPVARDCVALVGEHLQRASERHPPGRAWRTPPELMPDADRGAACFNLGMAHGIPAVLALLAAIAGGEADAGGMGQLLAEGVGWLLAQELPPEAESRFPALTGCGDAARSSPLAWCHGDLGLAAALLAIARRLGNEAWERAAVRIALAAAGRELDPAHRGELGLCHGAAGLAHLFNRLYQATGEPLLAAAASGWFARILADLGERRTAGTPAWHAEQRKHPKLRWQRGFLNGDAGIGLAMLAAVSPDEPRWDHVLLVSLPGPGGAEAASC